MDTMFYMFYIKRELVTRNNVLQMKTFLQKQIISGAEFCKAFNGRCTNRTVFPLI